MEKVVKSRHDETKVKQEMDVNSVYVSEGSEPVLLVIQSMQTNTQNTSQPEDYFLQDIVKSEYDESERKQEVSSIDFPEYTEDKYLIDEPTSNSVSLDTDSVQTHMQNTTRGEKLVKSEYDENENKEEAASSDVRSTYTEDSVSKPTNELTSLVDPFSSTFQINTQHPDWSEEYVVKDEVKSKYDETEFKQENSSIGLESEVFTKATSDPISLVMDSVEINTQNIDTSEDNIFEPIIKFHYSEIDHNLEVSSIDFKLEYTQDKCTVYETTNDPISLVDPNPTCQIKAQNTDYSEDYNIAKVAYAVQRLDKPVSREISEITCRRSNLKTYLPTHTGQRYFSCEVCPKTYSRRSYLKRHLLTHTGEKCFSCDVCSKPCSLKSSLKIHMLTHTGQKIFSCDVCSKAFVRRSDLNRHLLTHTGEKCFSCDICSKACSQKSSLKRHMLTHTGQKFFSCDVCSKAFSSRGNLKAHLLTHTGEKSFSCDICSKACSQKSGLKKHMLTHTGQKIFSCDVCYKKFSLKSHLKSHQLTHTGEKFFSCDVCSKAFSRRENLKAHQLTHTGEKFFSCDVCSKEFSLKSHLRSHQLTHTGEKFFSCDICSKAFSRRGGLKSHLLTHTGERYFSCDVCTKTFSRRGSLKTHLLTHTGEKFFIV